MNGFQPPQPPQQQQPMQGAPAPQGDVESNKGWAILAYLGILLLIPLLAKRDSPYVWYHVKQGIVLLGTCIVWGALSPVFIGILTAILPYSMQLAVLSLWGLASFAVWIGLLVLWIIGIKNALSGEMKPLPIIGALAEKF